MPVSDEEVAQLKGISVTQVELLRASRGATNDTLAGMPTQGIRRAVRRLEYPDMPRARQGFRAAQARDDDGYLAPAALGEALQELGRLRARAADGLEVAGIPASGDVEPAALIAPGLAGMDQQRWEWLGPGNVGGRTRSIVVHPAKQAMWVGSVAGGVWHSTDRGASWLPADDRMANLAVSCMVADPNHHDTVYAGTGEGFFNIDALRGAGIFRTTDGVSWAQLPATSTPDFIAVNRLAVSGDSSVLLAATGAGLLRTADPQRETWDKVLDTAIADVRFHPADSGHAVAGSLRRGEAYWSADGGRTWHPASHGPWSGRVELTYSVKDPSIVYASVQMAAGEIWRSDDGGRSYTKRATLDISGRPAPYLGDQGWYGNTIWCGDPAHENLIVTGGINLWRSTDAGDTLAEISTWWATGSVHADHHAIVSDPGYDGMSNRRVYFGNDGGVFTAEDIRAVGGEPEPPYVAGWTELDNNYGVTQFYAGAGKVTSGKIIGGAQDNGTLCYDPAGGTEKWTAIFGGDGGWCASDPQDPGVFYGEYVYLNIHRNTDGGTTDDTTGDRYISGQFWNEAISDFDWKPAPYLIPDAKTRNALFIAPFVLDPQQPQRILAGGLSLWRTDDAKTPNTPTSGPRWAAVKPGIGEKISAIAIAPGHSEQVWVGHEQGTLFRSLDATAGMPAWQRMDGAGPKPLRARRYCTGITIDPADPAVVYVTFGGFVGSNVWATRDGGATWDDLSAGLPAVPIRALAVHPRRREALYLGTEVGLFASEDSGATWSPTNEGPTNCSVDDLFWMGEALVSVTHGRGMFRIDLSSL